MTPIWTLLASIALVSVAVPSQVQGATQSRAYIGSAENPFGVFCTYRQIDDGFEVGGVCFDVPAGNASATISIKDDFSPLGVGAKYEFLDGSYVYGSGYFCDSTTANVPAQAIFLRVHASNWYSTVGCSSAGVPGLASKGTISVSLHP